MPKADSVHSTQYERAPELIEPFSICDTWVEGLARIDRIGPCRRLLFFASDPTAPKVRLVVAKLILPAEVLADVAHMLAIDINQPQRLAELVRPARAN